MKAPRSLLWRLGALALAVTLVSLALHVAVIAFWIHPLADALLGQLTSRAHITRNVLLATPTAQRDALVLRMQDAGYQLARASRRGDEAAPAPPPPIEALRRALGPGFGVRFEPTRPWSLGPRRFWIDFDVEGEPWQIAVRAQPPLQAVLGTGIGWLVLAAAAVGASLLIGLRFIVRPIREVAQRIAGQRGAMQPVPEPGGASSEVRSLVESFNRLVERVRAADRTKQQLLAGVSHDLRTPLSRLRLRIETQCEPRVAEAAEPELRAVEHIVSQFMAFVHGDSGAGLGPPQSVLRTAEEVVASYAQQGVHVALEVAAPDTNLGALAVQRLLSNLIDNALAHGAQPVTISWRTSGAAEHELGVWDHGPGLSEAEFRAALEPFVRLSKDAPIGHCGLGLAIAAQIAQQCAASLESRRDTAGRFGIIVTWSRALRDVR